MLSVKLHSAREVIKEMHDVKTTIVVGCAKQFPCKESIPSLYTNRTFCSVCFLIISPGLEGQRQ